MSKSDERGNVSAHCPECQAITSFEAHHNGRRYGFILRSGSFRSGGAHYGMALYMLVRCAGCGRGGLAIFLTNDPNNPRELVGFYPLTTESAKLPKETPKDIVAEVREAERCAAVGAWRAGSAMLRSALEKTLEANGYTTGKLYQRIEAAAGDGVITAARKQRAHDQVRDLGNDVLHEAWREVTETEFESAHFYTQRLIEDFYDHRAEVEAVLVARGKLKAKSTAAPSSGTTGSSQQ